MNINSLGASALMQYATSLLDPTSTDATSEASTSASVDLTGIDMKAKLAEGRHDVRSQIAKQKLDQQQSALGAELVAGLKKQGIELSGDVSFSVDKDGAVSVTGQADDVEKVQNAFKGDTTQPSLKDRMAEVLQSAQALSDTAQTHNAISMAARYAGSASNVMALYNQFTAYQDHASAKLTLSAGVSSLSYAGMVSSQA
jgi:hypothetical protein